jgi:hypothetical protein
MSDSASSARTGLEVSSTRFDEIPSSQVLPTIEHLVMINSGD